MGFPARCRDHLTTMLFVGMGDGHLTHRPTSASQSYCKPPHLGNCRLTRPSSATPRPAARKRFRAGDIQHTQPIVARLVAVERKHSQAARRRYTSQSATCDVCWSARDVRACHLSGAGHRSWRVACVSTAVRQALQRYPGQGPTSAAPSLRVSGLQLKSGRSKGQLRALASSVGCTASKRWLLVC